MIEPETDLVELAGAEFSRSRATVIKQAIIITGSEQGTLRGDILLQDGKIADIATTLDVADAQNVDGSEYIVCSGFIDTHRHLWQSLYKGFVYDMSLWDAFENLYGTYSMNFTADDIYVGTLLGRLAALDAGVTTVLDWAHNVNSVDMEDAGIQALRDARGRSVFGHGYRGDRVVASEVPRYWDQPRAFEDVRRTRELLPDDDALISSCYLGLEPDYFISVDACRREFEIARELGMRISVHINSSDDQFRPIASLEAMHAAGIMGDDVTYVHLFGASDKELALIADTGGTASVCPQVDAHIFSPPPTGRLLAAGVRPSLSLDSPAAGSEDYFSQMRAAFDVERTITMSGFQPRPTDYQLTLSDVFEFATLQGARALGQEHRLGTVSVGKAADLLFIDTTSPNMLPVLDPVAATVFHATTRDIDTVLVDGVPVKRGGRLLADLDTLHDRVAETVDRLYWKNSAELPPAATRPHPASRRLLCI